MGKLKSFAELTNLLKEYNSKLEACNDNKERDKLKRKIRNVKEQLETLMDEDNTK